MKHSFHAPHLDQVLGTRKWMRRGHSCSGGAHVQFFKRKVCRALWKLRFVLWPLYIKHFTRASQFILQHLQLQVLSFPFYICGHWLSARVGNLPVCYRDTYPVAQARVQPSLTLLKGNLGTIWRFLWALWDLHLERHNIFSEKMLLSPSARGSMFHGINSRASPRWQATLPYNSRSVVYITNSASSSLAINSSTSSIFTGIVNMRELNVIGKVKSPVAFISQILKEVVGFTHHLHTAFRCVIRKSRVLRCF